MPFRSKLKDNKVMKAKSNALIAIILLAMPCFITYSCGSGADDSASSVTEMVFKATGNTDPEHRPPERKRGEVVVTFDLLPTHMSFNLPSFPCLVTENGISFYNGWTETYDSKVGGGSFEPLMDFRNAYNRMWIESQNDARIVVRWRGALCNTDEIIAHLEAPSGSPYGEGDWMDEWYYIYPDGMHVRKSRIYTYYAPVSKPFGWDREPPNYVHEFQEMLFFGEPGHLPEDDIQTEALTLIRMNGENTTISYDPYPIHFEPEEDELYASFGEFWNANIFVVNTKSEYHPFTIGREEGVSISPYAPERDPLPGIFQSWPQEPDREEGYDGSALGHILNRVHYQKTENTLTQIYLSGWTNSSAPDTILAPLARSWLHAPEINMISKAPSSVYGYDPSQRTYLLENGNSSRGIEFEVAASEESPAVNPVFLINNWDDLEVDLELNGSVAEPGSGFRYGHYNLVTMEDGHEWKDVLVVWVPVTSSEPLRIKLSPHK